MPSSGLWEVHHRLMNTLVYRKSNAEFNIYSSEAILESIKKTNKRTQTCSTAPQMCLRSLKIHS